MLKAWLIAIHLLAAVALPSDARQTLLPSMLPTGQLREHAGGVAFSTHGNLLIENCSWRHWYLQFSKKIWFGIDHRAVAGLRPVFTYQGKPILHSSQVSSAAILNHYNGQVPVVWGDVPGSGWGRGPAGTRLYLHLWTRWTWLHPEACRHPEHFGVDFFGPEPTSSPYR